MMNALQANSTLIQNFSRLVAKNKLAHAYLLAGPADSGKTQTALALAQLVNCQEGPSGPCGGCVVCLKIASGNHPDVYVIGHDEKESIKIEDVRVLLSRAQLKSYEARYKVFIIRNIELMTAEAANALLKTLEEPAANTLMILTTSVLEANLETIRSRCHIIKFSPSGTNRITRLLMDEGHSPQQAFFLAVFGEGTLGKVRRLIKEDIFTTRQKVLDEMLQNRHNDEFLKELSGDALKAAVALQLVLSFFRDVLLLKNKAPREALVFQDRFKELEMFARRDMMDLVLIIRQTIETKKLLDDHLNVRMSLGLLREYLWEN